MGDLKKGGKEGEEKRWPFVLGPRNRSGRRYEGIYLGSQSKSGGVKSPPNIFSGEDGRRLYARQKTRSIELVDGRGWRRILPFEKKQKPSEPRRDNMKTPIKALGKNQKAAPNLTVDSRAFPLSTPDEKKR